MEYFQCRRDRGRTRTLSADNRARALRTTVNLLWKYTHIYCGLLFG